jgi:hypothetical protein
VRDRTMSRNSCEFGTGAISFQVVFMSAAGLGSSNWERVGVSIEGIVFFRKDELFGADLSIGIGLQSSRTLADFTCKPQVPY